MKNRNFINFIKHKNLFNIMNNINLIKLETKLETMIVFLDR